jgi:UDP-2,3-diacylglucosamine pyrophosphatase LpxH
VTQKKYKLVVSDFHLGKGRYLGDGTPNILEDFIYDREFSEFLDYHCRGEFELAEVELVLNGDILNLLQMDSMGVHTHLVTERNTCRAIQKIAQGHPQFFDAIQRFCTLPGHSVSYVIGNHDAALLWPMAQKEFSRACGSEIRFYNESYRVDGVHIEHGQQYERFARIDPARPFISKGLPEPVLNLPWGSLFVAVLLPEIKQSRPHVDKVRPFSSFLSWTLVHDPIWSLKTAWRIVVFVIQTILIKTRYQISFGVEATLALLSEITLYPHFDQVAFRILEENAEVHTVIFGHTHVLKQRQWGQGKQYINDGTWNEVTSLDLNELGTKTRLTYAYIEYVAAPSGATLRAVPKIKEWRGVWRPEQDVIP